MPKIETPEFEEGKFIVINTKRFYEMGGEEGMMAGVAFMECVNSFRRDYERATGKKMDQKYIVCNQDEPYAERVKAIILGTEDARDAAIRAESAALLKTCGEALKAMAEPGTVSWGEVKRLTQVALAALKEAGVINE